MTRNEHSTHSTSLQRLASAVSEEFRRWRERRELEQELSALPAAERDAVLRDLNIDASELDAIMQAPDSLMTEMLRNFGIDPAYVEQLEPELYRDMRRTCAGCSQHRHCRHELDRGASRDEYRSFCLNAYLMDALRTEAARRRRESGRPSADSGH